MISKPLKKTFSSEERLSKVCPIAHFNLVLMFLVIYKAFKTKKELQSGENSAQDLRGAQTVQEDRSNCPWTWRISSDDHENGKGVNFLSSLKYQLSSTTLKEKSEI